MKCSEASALIAAFADGEIDRVRAHRIGQHLPTCSQCTATYEAILGLRTRIRNEVPRYQAPADLRAKLKTRFGHRVIAPLAVAAKARQRWRWLGAGAAAGCTATVLTWFCVSLALDWRATRDTSIEAVTSHVRATLANGLIQVASSDQHTVKPWLSARLDYSPPVRDLGDAGFTLMGGRIDYLDGRRVATLVYRYRDHTIDVFVRPGSERFSSSAARTVRGFNVLHAAGNGMDWLAVSDVNTGTLSSFMQRLVQQPGPRATGP